MGLGRSQLVHRRVIHNQIYSLCLVLCLRVRRGAYPTVEHLKDPSLRYALALSANIRLGWKSLPETNTLIITITHKKFYRIGPRCQLSLDKTFFGCGKIESLLIGSGNFFIVEFLHLKRFQIFRQK
jgi:hypothetical protein